MRDFRTFVNDPVGDDPADPNYYGATNINNQFLELEQAVSRSGQTLSTDDGTADPDTTQLAASLFINSVKGGSFATTGTANAITLTPISGTSGVVLPADYTNLDGTELNFIPSADNTGNVTASIGQTVGTQFGSKKLLSDLGAELPAGTLVGGQRVSAVYSAAADSAAGAWLMTPWSTPSSERDVPATFKTSVTFGAGVADGSMVYYNNGTGSYDLASDADSTKFPVGMADFTNSIVYGYGRVDGLRAGLSIGVQRYLSGTSGGVTTTRPTTNIIPCFLSLNTTDVFLNIGAGIADDATGQVQSNWNETNTSALSYIQNKPNVGETNVNADWDSTGGDSEILNKPNVGKCLQVQYTSTTASTTTFAQIAFDNSAPTTSEGTQILSDIINPAATSSRIKVDVDIPVLGHSVATFVRIAAAIFRGTTCINVVTTTVETNTETSSLSVSFIDSPGSSANQTYSVRIGSDTGSGLLRINGNGSGDLFGNACRASMSLMEIGA